MPVFISYSQKDETAYKSLCLILDGQNIEHWSTKSMKVGSSLREQLRGAINDSEVCIFLATTNSIESKWCLAEIGAFWGRGINVVVFINDSSLNENQIPVQFKGDLWTRDPNEVINAVKAELKAAAEANNVNYGIEVQKPVENEEVRNPVEIRGTFKNMPPYHCIAVWECDPSHHLLWPKKYVNFDQTDNLWFANVHIGGGPKSERLIIIAAMKESGRALFEYSRKVADMVSKFDNKVCQWPGIDLLTSDIVKCKTIKIMKAADSS